MERTKTDKQELFKQCLEATDKYTRAVELEIPFFEDYYDYMYKTLYDEIVANGWADEYDDYFMSGGEMQ